MNRKSARNRKNEYRISYPRENTSHLHRFPLRLIHGKFVRGADARCDYPEIRKIHGPIRVGVG